MTRRTLTLAAAVLAGGFALLQFVRPSLPHEPTTQELQAPPEIRATLHRSCYSCHSNEGTLPIYDRIVPAYWLVAQDVRNAQKHLNFNDLAKQPAARQRAVLFEAVTQIQLGAMPLPRYLAVHHDAVVTPEELAQLKTWLATPLAPPPPVATVDAADAQYRAFSAAQKQPIAPEWNGIPIPAGYQSWKPIGSTDRWDNGTVRQILGNDIAIKALAEGHINPWPDGTMFAKVAWAAQPGKDGDIHAGEFRQVEFMIRDQLRYKDTAGWGWGRWLGTGLKPYGKDAHFTSECVSCHLPVRNDDYVYTMPLRGTR